MENIIIGNKEYEIIDSKFSAESAGRISKVWVRDAVTRESFLLKTGTRFGMEPYSEVMAYIVGTKLGFNVLPYSLLPIKVIPKKLRADTVCNVISVCKNINTNMGIVTSIASIKREINRRHGSDKSKYVTNKQTMYAILTQQYIDSLLLFDAIIGNEDRHYGNVHVVKHADGTYSEPPFIDNGASLLAMHTAAELILAGKRCGEWFDKSFTLESTHSRQIRHINSAVRIPNKELVIQQIIQDMSAVINQLHAVRRNSIKHYIAYRINKFM